MKMHPFIAAASLALSLAAFGYAGLAAADRSADSKAVWDRHVRAATAGDIDAVMEDFTEESVIITTGGVIEGKEAIRGFFVEFLGAPPPETAAASAGFVVNHEIVHDDIVVFNFAGGGRTFHDTAVIADGKIRVISTVDYAAE